MEKVVSYISQYIVQITTPSASGTGFVFAYNETGSICGIATAMHVVAHADNWQQPIRIRHHVSSHNALLDESQRVILSDYSTDSSIIVFHKEQFPFPKELVNLQPLDLTIDVGSPVGWLGFPSIDPMELCFFAGSISAHKKRKRSYLIDGIAINGVSGGPVFHNSMHGIKVIGIINAYKFTDSPGALMPGLVIAQDVSHFHSHVQSITSLSDSRRRKQETGSSWPEPPFTTISPSN